MEISTTGEKFIDNITAVLSEKDYNEFKRQPAKYQSVAFVALTGQICATNRFIFRKGYIWESGLKLRSVKKIVEGIRIRRFIGIFVLLCFVFLGGCKESIDNYEGIAKSEIELIKNNSNTEFLYEYRGSSGNWVAVYVFYKMKNEEHHLSKPFLKYIGTGQTPTGQLSYVFTTGRETGKGTGTLHANKNGIYNLGTYGSGGLGPAEDDNFQVKMQVMWNGETEEIDLEPTSNS